MTGSWPVVRMMTLETLTLETLTLETSCLTSCLVRGGATVDSVASAGKQVALGLLDNIGQWTKFIVIYTLKSCLLLVSQTISNNSNLHHLKYVLFPLYSEYFLFPLATIKPFAV